MPDCMYCRAPIAGLEVLECGGAAFENSLNITVLYAHRQCRRERNCVDPDATWHMLCESLQALNTNLDDKNARARAVDGLDIIARWLRMGGFPPKLA